MCYSAVLSSSFVLTCCVFPSAGGERGAVSAEFSGRSGEGDRRHCKCVSTAPSSDTAEVSDRKWSLST